MYVEVVFSRHLFEATLARWSRQKAVLKLFDDVYTVAICTWRIGRVEGRLEGAEKQTSWTFVFENLGLAENIEAEISMKIGENV